jgi:hypothetical protein
MNQLADNFKPEFRKDVTVSVPGAAPTAVAPKQCLTMESAEQLKAIFEAEGLPCSIVEGHPMNFAGGATVSHLVPYLRFHDGESGFDQESQGVIHTTGTTINAGLLADYWVHNPPKKLQPVNVALRNALLDYDRSAKDQSFSPIVPPRRVDAERRVDPETTIHTEPRPAHAQPILPERQGKTLLRNRSNR